MGARTRKGQAAVLRRDYAKHCALRRAHHFADGA